MSKQEKQKHARARLMDYETLPNIINITKIYLRNQYLTIFERSLNNEFVYAQRSNFLRQIFGNHELVFQLETKNA